MYYSLENVVQATYILLRSSAWCGPALKCDSRYTLSTAQSTNSYTFYINTFNDKRRIGRCVENQELQFLV